MMRARGLLTPLAVAMGLLLAWQALVTVTGLPPFLLPGPGAVAEALWSHRAVLAHAAG